MIRVAAGSVAKINLLEDDLRAQGSSESGLYLKWLRWSTASKTFQWRGLGFYTDMEWCGEHECLAAVL